MEKQVQPTLNAKDIEIIRYYVENENRELYFNYLAQKAGNDGYGLLALGVVRNDNAPGATANNFAAQQAARDGVVMKESGWQDLGVALIERDFGLREGHYLAGRADLALNLPVRDVQVSHDPTFVEKGIDRDGWTPRKLLEAARDHGGEAEAEKVWTMLLDNRNHGADRAVETTRVLLTTYNDEGPKMEAYVADMSRARVPAGLQPTPNADPDRIELRGQTYQYQPEGGQWRRDIEVKVSVPLGPLPIPVGSFSPASVPVTDKATLEYLDDARHVRQQRQDLRDDFHPEDPNRNRPIMKSPQVLAGVGAPEHASPAQLAQATDPRSPDHARNGLYQQCAAGVRGLDAEVGKGWDRHSECMTASLTTLAATNRLDRVDQVLLTAPSQGKAGGDHVFVVQGALDDPTHRRAHMPTAQAITTPPEQSFQQLAALDQERARAPAMQMEHAQADPARSSAAMQI
ncbi:hypothetical protein D3C87_350540 [compost metagenome]